MNIAWRVMRRDRRQMLSCMNLRITGTMRGHFWGHVQAIRPPSLLKICGPLFMSYPPISNLQYRLTEENGMTRLKFTDRVVGQIPHDAQIERGWDDRMARIRSAA
jgi:hypothetical protein